MFISDILECACCHWWTVSKFQPLRNGPMSCHIQLHSSQVHLKENIYNQLHSHLFNIPLSSHQFYLPTCFTVVEPLPLYLCTQDMWIANIQYTDQLHNFTMQKTNPQHLQLRCRYNLNTNVRICSDIITQISVTNLTTQLPCLHLTNQPLQLEERWQPVICHHLLKLLWIMKILLIRCSSGFRQDGIRVRPSQSTITALLPF